MNELAELKMILVGISSRLERIEAALGAESYGNRAAVEGPSGKTEVADFTTRQHVVMQAVVQGWDNEKIARWMGISPITVKSHLKGAADKLGVTKRAEVAVAASALLSGADADEYRLASGGLPIDWVDSAEVLSGPEDDPLRELYRPVKKTKTME